MATEIENVADEAAKKYEQQISNLKKEVARLKKSLAKQAAQTVDEASSEASEVYDTVKKSGAQAARVVGRQAQVAADRAIEHPALSAGVLAGIGILIGLLLARRDWAPLNLSYRSKENILNRNGLYLIIGALLVAVVGLGIYAYREETKPAGIALKIGEGGVSVEQK
jgi:ElaB/YqjD/DUF883 family membrane-anchored ribosome-binding protein